MIKSKKQSLIVIGVFTLVLMLGTVTYAFFNYTRTGTANVIKVGRISFITRQTETINLTNVFPIDSANVDTDTDNVDSVVVEIEGDTDYANGIEYLVSATDASIYTNAGQAVPISLDITLDDLGTPSASYFTARNNTNTSIYKQLAGDTLLGDEMLLVGYIVPNNPTGTADGIDGSITIKAFFDKDKILISDTYDGTESDNMGTTNSMAEGKTVITTSEWNALQTNGVSFKIKVEANEGIWVNGSLEEKMRAVAVMDNINSTYVNNATPGIDFSAESSDTNGKGVYIMASTASDDNPIYYYRGDIEDNNVLLGGICWKAIRTTDTGGIKMIYNGEYTDNNKCNNSGVASLIEVGGSTAFEFNADGIDLDTTYMSGQLYPFDANRPSSVAYFGTGFTYDNVNNLYTLTNTKVGYDGTHHYSCNLSEANATCQQIRYYYYTDYYIILENGSSIEDQLAKPRENTHPTIAKQKVDSWYADNMTNLTSKLEDTVWCSDRDIASLGGWDPTGGDKNGYLVFNAFVRATETNQPSLACNNMADAFTVNSTKGNRKLTYPVALINNDEVTLAGAVAGTNETFYLNSGSYYYTMTPAIWTEGTLNGFIVDGIGTMTDYPGFRPVISLKPGQLITKGTGTVTDPYFIG